MFLIIVHPTRNTVHPIKKNPLRLEINPSPVFSNDIVIKRNTDVKTIEVHIMNLLSVLRNGSAIKKSPIGNMKNCIPPHEARPNASKIPAPTILAAATYTLSDFIPLRSR